MTKNTIGQFVAALRKANGMTQQEVADRLHVSNKAVSRWERDECAPDLSVIPALAEMFGVTCDELLKGERIPEPRTAERKEPKVAKQVKSLVNRTLSGFKTLIWISLAVAMVGLVCMFGISYGFYRPVIGFAVLLLFEICALAIAVLAVSRTKDAKADNELFEMAESALMERFHSILGNLSFAAFFTIFAALILSLPLVLMHFVTESFQAVLSLQSYFTGFFGYTLLLLIFVYLKCKAPYIAWVTGGEISAKELGAAAKIKSNMSRVQLSLCAAAGAIILLAPYLATNRQGAFPFYEVAAIFAIVLLAANIVSFAVYVIKNKDHRKTLALPGIRNILMIAPALLLSNVHEVCWTHIGESILGYDGQQGAIQQPIYQREDIWHTEFVWYAAGMALAIFLIFGIIDMLIKKKTEALG